MKSSLPFWVLSATAVALVAANVAVRHQLPADALIEKSAAEEGLVPESEAKRNASDKATPRAEQSAQGGQGSLAPVPASTPKPAFNWAAVETTDYKQYAANLRALGFPEELVQTIVIADLNKFYEPQEAPLRPKAVPYDTPVSQRPTRVTPEDFARMRQLREVQMQKQAAIKEILGIYVPREIMKTPSPRNYESFEYALSLLPPEKRDAVQIAVEDDWYANDVAKEQSRGNTHDPAFLEAYQRIRVERNAIMMQVITPAEFEQFEMNTLPAGTELARRVIGMEPTEAEFRAMFSIAWDNWVETGGVIGVWRAVRVPPEQIAAADAKLNARMEETLGPDRYLDYQMATTETGQQLRNLAARYDLSRETLAHAFQLQLEADQLNKSLARTSQPGSPNDLSQLQARFTELQQQTEQILGPAIWQAWTDGRSQRVKLEP